MSLYRNILKHSWKIVWGNKYLWFFGLFAALLGNGGEYDYLIRFIIGDSDQLFILDWQKLFQTGIFSGSTLDNMQVMLANDPFSLLIVIFILLIVVFLSLFILWLSVVSLIAIVNNSAQAFIQKNESFRLGLETGMANFWPVFWLSVVGRITIYGIFAIVSFFVGQAVALSSGLVNLVFLFAFLIFMPLSIVASFVIKYAIAYVVLKKKNFGESLLQGWNLFIRNWLVSVEMAFFLFFINFCVGLAAVLGILSLSVPFFFLAIIARQFSAVFIFWLISYFGLVLLLVIIASVGACLAIFQISAWTKLFMELENGNISSKIARTIGGIFKK